MRASELLVPFPVVTMDTPAAEAARLLAGRDLPGLIVVDDAGRPLTVLPGTQVLRLVVPAVLPGRPGAGPGDRRADRGRVPRASWPGGPWPGACPREHPELAVVGPEATVAGGRRADGPHPVARWWRWLAPTADDSARSRWTRCSTGCSDSERYRLGGGGGLRRRVRADRHREGPPGRRRAGRGGGDAADRRDGRPSTRSSPTRRASTGTSSSCCWA